MTRRPTFSARQAIAEAYSIFSRSPGPNENIGFKSKFRAEGNEATQTKGTETRGKKDPTDFIAWVMLYAAKVISCVEKQPEPFSSWARYAYSDTYLPSDKARVITDLWADFIISSGGEPRKARVLKHLVLLSIEDYRYKVNTNERKYATADLVRLANQAVYDEILKVALKLTPDEAKARKATTTAIKLKSLQINPKNWHRDYLPHFVKMQEILDRYDQAALVPVAKELKKLQKVFDIMKANQ